MFKVLTWFKICWGTFILAIIFLLCIGYCVNVVKLARCDFKAPYKTEVLRGVGIFPVVPMGAVLGWMELKDQ